MTTDPKPCHSCRAETAWKGNACRMCYAVDLAMTVIVPDYLWTEWAGLREQIASHKHLAALRDDSRAKGAWISGRLATMLLRIAGITHRPEWEFRNALFRRLDSLTAEYRQIDETEGLENYRRKCAGWMKRAMEGAYK